MKRIVIVGGGTAGWLTALYAKKIYKDFEVTLIESEDIGILGAGEGATPHLSSFLEFLEIPVTDIIKNCKATIKTSIKFTNWTKDNNYFHHPFFSQSPVSNESHFRIKNIYEENLTSFAHYLSALENHTLDDYSLLQQTANNYQVPYINKPNERILERYSDFSLHFDARLLASFLKTVGQQRGIILKEGVVSELISDDSGNITSMKTEKELIECDFIFDCTGFKRLIIGNFYKSPWKSHSRHLPAKKAIPFFLEIDEKIPPYTEAIAMNYGWMWKIPLQHRYGCGYVFDSDYISDEEAVKEIESFLGYEPTYPRKDKGAFKFSAGCYEKIWIKNVLAIGLSSGFIEPLEATSIMQSIIVLRRFMTDKNNLDTQNETIKNRFNNLYLKDTQEIVEFLYLHYVTNKQNTDFWTEFTQKNEMPEKIKYALEVSQNKPLNWHFDFPDAQVFESQPYNYVLIGNDLLSQSARKVIAEQIATKERKKEYKDLLDKQRQIVPQFLGHRQFLELFTQSQSE